MPAKPKGVPPEAQRIEIGPYLLSQTTVLLYEGKKHTRIMVVQTHPPTLPHTREVWWGKKVDVFGGMDRWKLYRKEE